MTRRKAFALGLLLAISASCVSCVGRNRRVGADTTPIETTIASVESPSLAQRQWEGGQVFALAGHKVALPLKCDARRAGQLIRNVRFVIAAFESDYGPLPNPLIFYITDREVFQMAVTSPHLLALGVKTMNIRGVCCGDEEIAVCVGALDCMPALYHELCHAALPDAGGDHENPLWAKWDKRGDDLAAAIRSRWH